MALETGCLKDFKPAKPLTYHDNYLVNYNNPSSPVDHKHSLAIGIMLLTKKDIRAERIFLQINDERTLIARL